MGIQRTPQGDTTMTEKQAEIPIGPFTTITVDIGDQPIPKTAEKVKQV